MEILACAMSLSVLATVLPCDADPTAPFPEQGMTTASAESSANDFDFLVGQWTAYHRRLKERLAGNTQWEQFEGTSTVRKLMNGQANFDDNVLELPAGRYRAVSLRSFDPSTRLWATWWLDGRVPHHRLDPPVVGSFSHGVGAFYADDVFKDRPIRVRYLWSDITAKSCRWQQAFSTDGGRTWETNWIVDFKRVAH